MLGHHYSVQQTEVYAVTEQQAIGREMLKLKGRLLGQAELKDRSNIIDITAIKQYS